MANDLTKNPWVVDTAAAGSLTADRMRVRSFRWAGATTAGHKVIVKDDAGDVMWESFAPGANFIEAESFGGGRGIDSGGGKDCGGIAVTTLDSGKLYIAYL